VHHCLFAEFKAGRKMLGNLSVSAFAVAENHADIVGALFDTEVGIGLAFKFAPQVPPRFSRKAWLRWVFVERKRWGNRIAPRGCGALAQGRLPLVCHSRSQVNQPPHQ